MIGKRASGAHEFNWQMGQHTTPGGSPGGGLGFTGVVISTSTGIDYGGITDSTLQLNKWELLVGTYNNGRWTLYKNGNLAAQKDQSVYAPDTNAPPLEIGNCGNWGAFFGKIDDIRIYNRALTQTEISILASDTLKNNSNLNLTWSLVSSGDCINITQGKVSNDLFLVRRTDVLKSNDGGTTWANTNWPLGIVRSNTSTVGGVAYSSFGNGQLAVAALDNGWYISSDDGANYQATGPTSFGTGAPGMTSLSDGRFISGNGGSLRGIYKTSGIDNLTWSQKYSGTDIYNFAKVNDDTLYSSGYGNEPLLKSFDKGETWTPMIQTQSAIDYITIKNDSILLANRDGNITVSSRFNFLPSSSSKYTLSGASDIKRGFYSSLDNLLVISAENTGFYISQDFGNTFKLNTIPTATVYYNPSIIGSNIYINTNVGLYKSKFK